MKVLPLLVDCGWFL